MSISSGLVEQLAGPVPTGVVDLVPLVQGRCCRSEHDEKLLLEAQAAHPRGYTPTKTWYTKKDIFSGPTLTYSSPVGFRVSLADRTY